MNILILGDSHTQVFKYINNNLQSNYIFSICEVGGATAQGAVNPNSKTNALHIFKNRLTKFKKFDKIMIMLGEVDCGFVIWVRSKKYGISVDHQISISIENLFKFIKENVCPKYKNEDIIIIGAVLPTIRDNTDKKFLGGARADVDASQEERTLKTFEYNNILQQKCKEEGYLYIDITNEILNKEKNIVADKYLNENPYRSSFK